jgi:hypothetical protein
MISWAPLSELDEPSNQEAAMIDPHSPVANPEAARQRLPSIEAILQARHK